MNPMTNVKNIKKLNEQELRRTLKTSWHDQYKDSAWIFVGGLPYDLTEGDIICVFSQYGEVVNINLVRDKDTGKQKGFCFLCYEDQRSTNLAVDNFNGIKLLGRTLRVDHVADYKAPKDSTKKNSETRRLLEEGCATTTITPTDTGTASAATLENIIPNIKKEKEDDKSDCMIIEQETPVTDLVKGVKSEFKSKKKRKDKVVPKVKVKKEKDSDKKKKRTKRRNSSSSSSDESSSSSNSSSESSTSSSSEDSDSDEKKSRLKKHKHKLERKKKTKDDGSAQHGTQSSASSKRRKLEEKIKALEKALSSVRSGKSKQK